MATWTTVLATGSVSGAQFGQIAVGTNGWSWSIAVEPPLAVGAAEGADEVLGAELGGADVVGADDGAAEVEATGALLVTASGAADEVGCVPPPTTARAGPLISPFSVWLPRWTVTESASVGPWDRRTEQ